MKKDLKKSLKKQLENKNKKELVDIKWIIKITLITFIISLIFTTFSETIIPNVNLFIGIFILILFIFIGIIFDIIGVAVTAASIEPFNSMNSRKIKGADIAVLFKKNAHKVSSFCNDVVGDICGVVSGGASSIIAIAISSKFNIDLFICAIIITALVASITIGGKALGKSYAINKSNEILFKFSKSISYVYKIKK